MNGPADLAPPAYLLVVYYLLLALLIAVPVYLVVLYRRSVMRRQAPAVLPREHADTIARVRALETGMAELRASVNRITTSTRERPND